MGWKTCKLPIISYLVYGTGLTWIDLKQTKMGRRNSCDFFLLVTEFSSFSTIHTCPFSPIVSLGVYLCSSLWLPANWRDLVCLEKSFYRCDGHWPMRRRTKVSQEWFGYHLSHNYRHNIRVLNKNFSLLVYFL